MALECTPIFKSSALSVRAYCVSYITGHNIASKNSCQHVSEGASVVANTIGIDSEKAIPSMSCGQ